MKKTIFVIMLMIAGAVSLPAQSVDDLFKEYKNKNHVEYVEIPQAMMAFAKGIVKKEEGSDVLKRIKSIQILNIENDDDLCRDFSQKAIKLRKNGYETMVNSNEDQEKTLVLVKVKDDVISEMVILNIEPKECSLVRMKGKFRSSDIQKMDIN